MQNGGLLLLRGQTVQEVQQGYSCTFLRFGIRCAAIVAQLLSLDHHGLIFLNGKTQDIIGLETHMLTESKRNGNSSALTQNTIDCLHGFTSYAASLMQERQWGQ